MNLFDFAKYYPDEESAKLAWKSFRDQQGVVCKKCGGKHHYWIKTIWQYQCADCKFKTTLRSGTVMEASNLPFRYWLMVIHLITSTKKSFSALEMQRQLGHKRYEPIWAMLHKLRIVMGNRDDRYKLEGLVELDEAFFEHIPLEKKEPEDPEKRGRGSNKQGKVLVMASTEPVKKKDRPDKHSKPSRLKFIKMRVVDDLSSYTIVSQVKSDVHPKSTVRTDGYLGHQRLKEVVARHKALVLPPKEQGKVLPWVHTAISNAKRLFLGTHHSIRQDYLQNYLDEFCYKLNRNYFKERLFDRLMIASVTAPWYESQTI